MKWAITLSLILAAGCAAHQQPEPRVTRVQLTPKLLSYAVDHARDVIDEQLPAASTAVIYSPSQVLVCERTGGTYGKSVRRELFAAGTLDVPNESGAVIRQAYVISWVIAGGQPQGGYLCAPVMGSPSEKTISLQQMNAFSDALQQSEPPIPSATAGNRVHGQRQGTVPSS